MCAKSLLLFCPNFCEPMDCCPLGSSVHGDSPSKNTGVDCHALLQGVFLTQGSNPPILCLLHWQAGSLPLVPSGKPNSLINRSLLNSNISISLILPSPSGLATDYTETEASWHMNLGNSQQESAHPSRGRARIGSEGSNQHCTKARINTYSRIWKMYNNSYQNRCSFRTFQNACFNIRKIKWLMLP